VYDRAVEEAGEGAREITADGLFTVEEVECLGACDQAPVVQVNYCSYARVDEARMRELIEELRRGEVPEPVAGPKPVEHAATSRLLAGLGGSGRVARPGPGGSEWEGERTPRPGEDDRG
jgi:NADH-quinone oxidoreductase subunit E